MPKYQRKATYVADIWDLSPIFGLQVGDVIEILVSRNSPQTNVLELALASYKEIHQKNFLTQYTYPKEEEKAQFVFKIILTVI